MLKLMQPGAVAALDTSISKNVATVLTATPDLFEAQVSAGPITIPAVEGQDARTIRDNHPQPAPNEQHLRVWSDG